MLKEKIKNEEHLTDYLLYRYYYYHRTQGISAERMKLVLPNEAELFELTYKQEQKNDTRLN